jgi:fatty-acyl-CoA synthase
MSNDTIGVLDLAKALPRLALDAPSMMRQLPGLARSRNARESVGLAFQRVAHANPERPFLRFMGSSTSYREANERVNRYAHALRGLGVGRGDVVGIVAKNHPSTLLLVLAAVKLGASAGMVNHQQRGEVLAHSLGLLGSRVIVASEECASAIGSLTGPAFEAAAGKLVWRLDLEERAEHSSVADPPEVAQIRAGETAFHIFTSGTTGLPKASVMSHYRWLKAMHGLGGLGVRLRKDDVLYCCLPLYHNNALTVSLGAVLSAGACLAIGQAFSARYFWEDVANNMATGFTYIGELCRYLLNQPQSELDHSHRVRLAVGNGLRPEIWHEFTERFGIDRVVEFYGASEGNIGFVNAFNLPATAGICPLPHKVVKADAESGEPKRDERGRLIPADPHEPGLLIAKVTSRTPFDGYTDARASDSKLIRDAFRDGDCWFNTGDLVRDQGWWHIAFVDRLGDTFRWKGENVATTEVEAAIEQVPWVQDVTVFGVEVPGAEGRAGMAALAVRDGAQFDGAELAACLGERLPAYAVPLFVRVVGALEVTSTFKHRKVDLVRQGYAPDRASEVFVLRGRSEGYQPFDPDYPRQVAAGKLPR